jgi:polyferredoxin
MSGMALSRTNPIRAIVHWRWFPEVVQVVTLAAFVTLIAYGWGRYTPDGINDKLYAKSNIVNLLIWGLWWPAMILVAVLLGRIWCAVCPLELVSRLSESTATRLGIPQRSITSWMRGGWLILLFYGVVQMLIAAVHLHRVPMYTSLYLLALLGLALLSGLFFRKRAYCYSLCPVGMLLKVYGRGGMLAVRPAEPGMEIDPGVSRVCKSALSPMRLDEDRGDDCLMCLDCVKADRDKGRMQFLLRLPWSREDRRPLTADWPITLFIMMVSGFVAYEISGFWPTVKSAFLWAPAQVGETLGLGADNGWLKGLWMLFVFPMLLWTALGLVAMPFVRSWNLGAMWRRMALPASLIIMAAHMTKAIEKLATWGGYLPLALRDPAGETTARGITDKALASPAAIIGMPVIFSIGTILLIAALYLMRREFVLHAEKVGLEANPLSRADIRKPAFRTKR